MKNADNFIFSSKLKYYRNLNKFTQQQLADVVGVTKTTIYSYEKGESLPTIDILYLLCENLNVTPNDLLINKNQNVFSTNNLNYIGEVSKNDIIINIIQCLNIDKYFNYSFEDKQDFIHPSKTNHCFSLSTSDQDIVSIIAFYLDERKNNKEKYIISTKKKLNEINHSDTSKVYYGVEEEY